jgi:hypothetical protein
MSIEPAVLTPLRWSEVPITFSRTDQWTIFSEPGWFPLVLKPVVTGSKLNKVLIDGGNALNITHMLTKSTSPFYGIVPGNAAIPLGSVVLPVTFGEQGTTTVPSMSSSKSRTSRRPTMPSSANQLSPSSWRYPTTLGIQDANFGRCTLTARGLEDILRLRHRSYGTRSHE